MHIPENYLSPSTCAVLGTAMVPVWAVSVKKVKAEIPKEKIPLLGIGAAFSFLGMMFNIPLPGGTTGHAVGGVCAFGITNSNVKIYCDLSLKRFDTVFPACGSSNSAIELTIPEIEKYSGYEKWVDVTKAVS